jgi:hypothetical protein
LFSSIMSVEPEINPLHTTSKALSDEWLRTCGPLTRLAAVDVDADKD